ncbi:hypothetical protein Nepgr_031530 [Nepenthes gracilis]|uniref:Uncharacterized protein n=1 Tax=Nepenthes gracilis TaxID=150966 RepID=A0AAD3TJ19_NEPGR|nr:hypothetical protein Nepgr_031530 [Nepenthes gracilis]
MALGGGPRVLLKAVSVVNGALLGFIDGALSFVLGTLSPSLAIKRAVELNNNFRGPYALFGFGLSHRELKQSAMALFLGSLDEGSGRHFGRLCDA